MATTTGLITVAEFEKLIRDHVRMELRHGEVFTMPPPRMPHVWTQRRLFKALEACLGNWGVVWSEFPFRPLPEYECWSADVAFLAAERVAACQTEWLVGVPDIVVEVLSPSNTADEVQDREDICLRNGGRQFWTVSLERATIKVTSSDGRTVIYHQGDEIDLAEFGGGKLKLSDIFA